jgi:methionine-rich copper-binding protein CopC
VKKFLALVVLTIALLTWSAAPASAHAQLIGSDPPAGATMKALPEAVTLTFSAALMTTGDSESNHITVVDPMRETISAAHTDVNGAVASTVLSPSMVMDGTYHVSFRAVSTDGHVVEGKYTFRIDRSVSSSSAAAEADLAASGNATLAVTATGPGIPDGQGAPSGTALGTFEIDLSTSTVCYTVVTQGIPDVTAAHVHSTNTEAMTISDEIYVPVDLAAIDKGAPVCASLKRSDVVALVRDPSRYALVLHSRAHPEGAVSGTFSTVATSNLVLAAAAGSTPASTGLPLWLVVALGAVVVLGVAAAATGIRSSRSRPGATATDGGEES